MPDSCYFEMTFQRDAGSVHEGTYGTITAQVRVLEHTLEGAIEKSKLVLSQVLAKETCAPVDLWVLLRAEKAKQE